MQTTISSGTLTAAGALSGTLDISGAAAASTFAPPLAITLTISAMSATGATPPRARIVLEDSVDAFTTALAIATLDIEGKIVSDAPITVSWTQAQIKSLRSGTASAVIRARVAEITGTSPTITAIAALMN